MKISWRIWLLLIVLGLVLLAISPTFEKGVVIKSIEKDSEAFNQGLRSKMIINFIDDEKIISIDDYNQAINSIFPSEESKKIIFITNKGTFILFINQTPEITIAEIPKTKIKTGLDLSGGARALIKAENKSLSESELNDLILITSNRLNEFGIADVVVRPITDLSGSRFMLIEVAGATPSDLKELISEQGKFEAKIGNQTAFEGGEKDITYVARTGEQSGIYSCSQLQDGTHACSFRFGISLSSNAAKKHSEITCELGLNPENPQYLSEKLDLYLDDNLVDSLFIGKDLKCSETTQIQISGSGTGTTRQEAYDNALKEMKHLQTVLITGSLPFKLEIVKIDTVSPNLGKEFLKNITLLGLIAFIMVSLVIFIRYRKIKITLAVILTMFSEIFITLGIAALIKWNLDAPSIAGIIAGIGTGVNDQIVIIDEATSNKHNSLKERIKSALFVIIGAFFTIIAAMLPLFWAGAGLLKGFALTTIIGVSVGILITRPAFSEIIKLIVGE